MTHWEALWNQCAPQAATVGSCQQRLREHLLAQLVCPGRRTLSGLITVFGRQFQDWSTHYSLYAKDRVDPAAIFGQVRQEVEALGPPDQPLRVALDDTLLRKRGRCIPGTAFRRDPLGPAFQVNLVWAQREPALSAALPDEQGEVPGSSRSRPVRPSAGGRPGGATCAWSSSVPSVFASARAPGWPTPSPPTSSAPTLSCPFRTFSRSMSGAGTSN
ncbi:MAG: transposase [Verrucomicrobiales bacterium]|nr:transposase [Verrucomicrobiales bacterium]MCP5527409.1 transposase [Verrucomicrobiales bacterium]